MNFGRRISPLLITVSGGAGSVKFNPGLSGLCLTRGITPPAAAPTATYSYYVQEDSTSGIPDSGTSSGRQNWDGIKVYDGSLTFNIVGASDDGVYTVDIWMAGF